MNWYLTLTIEQKINLKAITKTICGLRYEDMILLFGMRGTIDLLHSVLKLNGFAV